MHVGESEIAFLGAVGEAFVIEAEAVEQRGLDVVNVDGVLGDVVAEIVGGTVNEAGFDTAPDNESFI